MIDINSIDWIKTFELIVGVITALLGSSWIINKYKNTSQNNISINGNHNSVNNAGKNINNVQK
ncbi:hypothetical protein RFH42_16320 [Acinetobacter rudis]|uniref:hypothetical protein n=1 Tax=Acinetobacter rudis TaxID=632955 RepID=UPI0028105704|nr:hypothetical protein [Acinetobacter rudis]MDQ8954516.1 hypothetical protein [Acinetobacter rudis]